MRCRSSKKHSLNQVRIYWVISALNALSSDSANALTWVEETAVEKEACVRQTGKSDPCDLSIAPPNIYEKTK